VYHKNRNRQTDAGESPDAIVASRIVSDSAATSADSGIKFTDSVSLAPGTQSLPVPHDSLPTGSWYSVDYVSPMLVSAFRALTALGNDFGSNSKNCLHDLSCNCIAGTDGGSATTRYSSTRAHTSVVRIQNSTRTCDTQAISNVLSDRTHDSSRKRLRPLGSFLDGFRERARAITKIHPSTSSIGH